MKNLNVERGKKSRLKFFISRVHGFMYFRKINIKMYKTVY